MRILAVYRGLPWPRQEGYHLRLLALAEHWSQRHEVNLLGLIHEDPQEELLASVRSLSCFAEVRILRMPARSGLGRIRTHLGLNPAASLLAERPGLDVQLERTVRDWQDEANMDVAWVFDPWADVFFHRAANQLPSLLDVCDCRSLYYQRRLEDPGLSLLQRLRFRQLHRRFRGLESFALQAYPLATAVSQDDRTALLELESSARVEVIPNGVDGDRFASPEGSVPEAGHLILFGNLDFLPNSDAALHFARDIFPLIRQSHPEVRFSILGTNPGAEVSALAAQDGVEVVGEVEDLRPWLARAAMLVAPIRYGAGIKNKILETAAAARPVVCSTRATASLHKDVQEHLRVADQPQAFAEQVCALLDHPVRALELGQSLQVAVKTHHTWAAAATRYEELFATLRS